MQLNKSKNNNCLSSNSDLYEQILRKSYVGSSNSYIVVKQGSVIKENLTFKDSNKTRRQRLLESQFKMNQVIYNEIKNSILKIYDVIKNANEEIEILEIQNGSQEIASVLLQTEIESTAEKMFDELSRSMRKLAEKAYKKVYSNLIETWTDVPGNTPDYSYDDLNEKELYGIINSWIKNFKNQFFNNINSAFDNAFLETKGYAQKGFFEDVFENIKDIFGKVKEKVDTLIRNVVSNVQTFAQKIAFKVQRVEKYQIIFSGHPNSCEKCEEMARVSKDGINIAELNIGETAPPFHPNCGCTMIPYAPSVAEKDGSLKEQIFIAANVAFELLAQIGPLEELLPPFYDWIKSAIWAAGTFYLENIIHCPLAAEMFSLGMYGNGKGMSKKATMLMIEAMQNSKHLQDKILELTQSGRDFDTGIFSFEFKKDEDEDLYYAVQNVNMRIIGTSLGDGTWNIRVISQDKYDFTTFRNSLAFADLANNLGEAMQRNGMMTEYDTLTEYECIWQRG